VSSHRPVHPARGDLWLADLDPTRGHEQAGRRPVLVISDDLFNQGPAELVVVVPLTSRLRDIALHVRVRPPEGGLQIESAVLCEAIRSVSRDRLLRRWGRVSVGTLQAVEMRLRALLRLF
jgi:mRNA interferase MazF